MIRFLALVAVLITTAFAVYAVDAGISFEGSFRDGSFKLGERKDPAMERCKQIQNKVAGYDGAFRRIESSLGTMLQSTQDKEVELRQAYAATPAEDYIRKSNLGASISEMQHRYYNSINAVITELDYVQKVWYFILEGCGLPSGGSQQ